MDSLSVGNRGRAILASDPAAELGGVPGEVSAGFSTGTASAPAAELRAVACFLAAWGDSPDPLRFPVIINLQRVYAAESARTAKAPLTDKLQRLMLTVATATIMMMMLVVLMMLVMMMMMVMMMLVMMIVVVMVIKWRKIRKTEFLKIVNS